MESGKNLTEVGAAARPSLHQETDVSRSRGDQRFTKIEVRRLMRLADAQGVLKYQIAIGSENGKPTYTLIVDKTAPATVGQTNDDLDKWIMKHENQT